jgi:hypothetical protein
MYYISIMKQLKAISFPRSGVSIFCRILQEYYKDTPKKVYYCNTVSCCSHKQPCKKTQTMDLDLIYMKNHDSGGKVANTEDKDIVHVVLYRKHAQDQINAYFRYSMDGRRNAEPKNRKETYQTDGKMEKYMNYLNRKTQFAGWTKFTNKWIYNNSNPNTYFLEYDDFMSNPLKHMTDILSCIDTTVNHAKMKKVLEELDVRKHFNMKDSIYYIEDFTEQFGLNDIKFDHGGKFLNTL